MIIDKPTIGVGQAIPDATIHIKSDGSIDAIETKDYFKDCKVIMIALPGAFTRTCSAKHLPGYIKNAEKIRVAGFDKIACLAVNDAHVMQAWGLEQEADGIVDMLADPLANFSDELGISVHMGPFLGRRAMRCAMVIENGILKQIFMEEPLSFLVSSAEHVLASL
ncbi:peroxiredoxin [Candidatus Puniceispirillum sp.]|nr:peroxiredoxin [Candidatus Puniceispirillum sp.]